MPPLEDEAGVLQTNETEKTSVLIDFTFRSGGCGIRVSEAFSAGLGMAMGLLMSQYLLQAMRPREVIVKRVIICHNCSARNPIEYKFCSNCGQSLYPPPQTTCQKCKAKMPATMKFCGRCGYPLKHASQKIT